MIQYTYTEMENFVLQHLYYSMGTNRMVWHDYTELMVPSLKGEIMVALVSSKDLMSEYNSHDIDTVIRKIKEKFQIFGHYEGYSEVNDSIQRYSWGQ